MFASVYAPKSANLYFYVCISNMPKRRPQDEGLLPGDCCPLETNVLLVQAVIYLFSFFFLQPENYESGRRWTLL